MKKPRVVAKRTEKDVYVAAPLFVQATHNGKLAAILKEEEEDMGKMLGGEGWEDD